MRITDSPGFTLIPSWHPLPSEWKRFNWDRELKIILSANLLTDWSPSQRKRRCSMDFFPELFIAQSCFIQGTCCVVPSIYLLISSKTGPCREAFGGKNGFKPRLFPDMFDNLQITDEFCLIYQIVRRLPYFHNCCSLWIIGSLKKPWIVFEHERPTWKN